MGGFSEKVRISDRNRALLVQCGQVYVGMNSVPSPLHGVHRWDKHRANELVQFRF